MVASFSMNEKGVSTPPPAEVFARTLTPFETLMVRSDDDPRARSTLTGIYLLDRAPDWESVRWRFDYASRVVPRFRQRVVLPAAPICAAVWAYDPDFSIDHHVRRVALASPGSMRQLLDLARREAMDGFDHRRPLWRAILVEGLADGAAALVQVVHHAVTDGVGGVALASAVFDGSREGAGGPTELPVAPPGEDVTPASLVQDALRPRVLAERAAGATVSVLSTVTRPVDSVRRVASGLRSVGRMREMASQPTTAALGERSSRWHFDALGVRLDDLKAAARTAGGTVNDAFLAAITEGVRRYYDQIGADLDSDVVIGMPISRRTADHEQAGNQWTGSMIALPTAVDSAADRIAILHERVTVARQETDVDVMGALAPVLNLMPTAALAALTPTGGGVAFQASNIPGSPVPFYIAGAEVVNVFGFGPLPGVAGMITMTSHAGTCGVGINLDASVPDAERFAPCLVAGFDDVLALAGDGRAFDLTERDRTGQRDD